MSEGGRLQPRALVVVDRALAVMDGAIVLGVALLLAYLGTGRIDLGVVTVSRVSKPVLVLLLLVAIRAAIPRRSWLTRRLDRIRVAAGEAVAAAERRTPWAAAGIDAAVAVLTVHVVLKLTAFSRTSSSRRQRDRQMPMPFEAAKLAETFAAWDSGWYFDIARRGYFFDPSGQSSRRLLPAVPAADAGPGLAVRRRRARAVDRGDRVVLRLLLPGARGAAPSRLGPTLGGREPARRTVLYVAVFPFAYFFTQVYTESLFLVLTVRAVAAAIASSLGPGPGCLGFLAALIRPNGC